MSPDEQYLCPFEVAGSVCILDDWHEGSHVVVPVDELNLDAA